jgi:hypothetical protein
MTRETVYRFEAADGVRGPLRVYRGVGFGDICAALPTWHDADIDGRLGECGGSFTRARLRAWIDCLPAWTPPRTLAELADQVEDMGAALEPSLALRLFLERLLRDMDHEGAVLVHITRG